MKAKEFISKFSLNVANNPTNKAFIVNEFAVNEFAYSRRLQPEHIEYNEVDDSTIEIYWNVPDWDDPESLVLEVKRYCNKYAQSVNLEDDVLVIFKIRNTTRSQIKDNIRGYKANGRYLELNDRGNEIMNMTHTEKFIISATTSKKSNNITLVPKTSFKVYTLDNKNIHWWYKTTGKNYSRAALYINKDGSYSINRDDMGSSRRIISMGAKVRGDGHKLWSGYNKDEPVKCLKLTIDTGFGMDGYIDLNDLSDLNDLNPNLFELNS